jgi:hypothetical protein
MNSDILLDVGAAVVGSAQTFALKEFVDKKSLTPIVPQLGKYGTASCLAGVGIGGVSLGIGLASLMFNKGIRDERIARALVSYGAPALITGALSGFLTPTVRRVVQATSSASQSTTPQAYFAPQAAPAAPAAARMGGVEANYANLSQMEKINLGVL